MQDQDTFSWQERVPTCLGAVFQQVVLIGVGIVHHLDSSTLVGVQGSQCILGILNWVDKIHPPHVMTFIGAIARWGITSIQVTTVIHQGPVAHAIGSAIIGRIEVWQTQAVAELVAKGADAINVGTQVVAALQLIKHGKLVDGHSIQLEWAGNATVPIVGLLHVPLARPYRLGHPLPRLRFTHTGIQHDNHIHNAIVIVIIAGEIHIVQSCTGIINHRSQLSINLGAIDAHVGAVKGSIVGQLHRTQNVKLR